MKKKVINFNSGRTALKYGLDVIKIEQNSSVLVPEIICDVAVKVFLRKNIKVIFYKLDKYFKPVWKNLKNIKQNNLSAILMVNFFGYPQDVEKFIKFAKEKKIFLIEDNCHSLNIDYGKRILGKIGHIGIDSPKKIINGLYSGGRLFINFKTKKISFKIPKYVPSKTQIVKNKIKNKNLSILKIMKFSKKRPNYESPYFFSDKDNDFSEKIMDDHSLNKIKTFKLNNERLVRYNKLVKLAKFAKKNDLKLIFSNRKNLLPMHFVGLTKNLFHRKKILDWGWKNQIDILTWPSFYRGVKINRKLINRWSKYVCIPLNQELSNIDEKRL